MLPYDINNIIQHYLLDFKIFLFNITANLQFILILLKIIALYSKIILLIIMMIFLVPLSGV